MNRIAVPSPLSEAAMHADQLNWASEHALWSDELDVWRSEFEKASQAVAALSKAIRSHRESLRQHAESVEARIAKHADHERALGVFERDGPQTRLITLDTEHRKLASRFGQQRLIHERMKRRHHTLMAYLKLLVEMLANRAIVDARKRSERAAVSPRRSP